MATMKFEIPEGGKEFNTLEEIMSEHSEAEVVEMVNRFWAAQWTAKKSRLERQAKEKDLRQALKNDPEIQALLKQKGLK